MKQDTIKQVCYLIPICLLIIGCIVTLPMQLSTQDYQEIIIPIDSSRSAILLSNSFHGWRETIIFIHGFPDTYLSFMRQMRYFEHDFNVLSLKQPGIDYRNRRLDSYEFKNSAEDILAVINFFEVDKVYLAGHDAGACVASEFAMRYPQHVQKIILLSYGPFNRVVQQLAFRPTFKMLAMQSYAAFFHIPYLPSLLVTLFGKRLIWNFWHAESNDNHVLELREAMENTLANYWNTHYFMSYYRHQSAPLKAFASPEVWEVPTLVIMGKDDNCVTPSFIQQAVEGLTDDLQFEIIDGAKHYPHHSQPDKVNTILDKFIR